VFAPGASGNVAPVATLTGSKTGLANPFGVVVDAAGRVAVMNGGGANTVTEYAPGASGNVAPIATIAGSNTGLFSPGSAALVTPVAQTGGASAVTATSATIGGNVNPDGSDAHYFFQYGLTMSYGKSTPVVDAGAGSVRIAVQAKLTSLSSHSTIHYRLVASSDAGVRYGADHLLTTL
jgi:hypothetical protein